MNTARNYYYDKLAPEENYLNYQQIHQSDRFEADDPILLHVPLRSNCKLIESYVDELISLTSPNVSKRLEKTFVAKKLNYLPNAGAVHDEDSYDGDLIFFRVGLSDLLFQFAILFTKFVRLRKLKNDTDEYVQAFSKLCVDIETLTEAQLDWSMNNNEIRFGDNFLLPDNDIVEQAVGVATLMDKSILRHEISHHILGHTKSKDVIHFDAVNEYLKDIKCTPNHLKELQADLSGIYLPLSGFECKEIDVKQVTIEVVLGTLLSQTVLAQLKSNILVESESHPSWYVRYTTSIDFIKKHYHDSVLNSITDDISKFQALLYVVQDKGLGVLQKDLLREVNQV
ncbi:hypothetical protein ACEV8A_24585 [Vibrio parahaemolyticus]|uniref:hypothetical protein n=4 Tax=Vibrio parahaemolyticus TaxID=670 RepID=UPI000944FDE7|nr:hypothetical protein [Vibrio parahaemolyticus]EHJ9990355.1 hypothetical protein [Vibrio parahaemolyticus]EJA3100733.1 hypothetical protein [Vibrio parahaemolyticus]MBE3727394.1 hypothetical protein [Vibrio parahaemolyticus]MBE3730190.1 hypothetical protein [Vibrio parahaemolyticus]MBE3856401.1 hypothetical protein [Vibrio parahaemolyticus]